MASEGFSSAAVIGTGMMGPGIAVTLALGGVQATILSRSPESAAAGLEKALSQVSLLETNGLAKAQDASHARALLTASSEFDPAIAAADLVIESAPEDMAFKQELFARMDRIASPAAVLASNTSGLSITEVASRCSRPERVLTVHFWNPPHLMPLVEIVKGERTDPGVALRVRDLLAHCGKKPVMLKKDRPGQLGNRLQIALMREAIHMVAEGIADPEEVDLAVKSGFGMRLPVYGPFEHLNMVGLDMALAIIDYISQDLYNQPRAPELLRRLIEQGHLGAKNGQGFYDWSKKDAAAVRSRRDAFVQEFLKSHR